MSQTVTVTTADGVTVITMNRPAVMNALNAVMRADLTAALTAAHGARVVVLTGAGRAFCAGQDLSDGGAATLDIAATLQDEYAPMLRAITTCPVPVIAAVNGAAAGAGANLALACDVVIACDSAVFVQAFTRIGLIPDAGGTWFLPRQVGLARAMGAMLFADRIPAPQAAAWGMIWESVPDDVFAAHWQARAATLARGPTTAYAGIKAALHASATNDLATQFALEAQLQATCGATADVAEGVAAFLNKRAPRFTGR
jgi:2-(1,2-epoxy-1,2-dihydrophenyl)acetyl-CoA isomerase